MYNISILKRFERAANKLKKEMRGGELILYNCIVYLKHCSLYKKDSVAYKTTLYMVSLGAMVR